MYTKGKAYIIINDIKYMNTQTQSSIILDHSIVSFIMIKVANTPQSSLLKSNSPINKIKNEPTTKTLTK